MERIGEIPRRSSGKEMVILDILTAAKVFDFSRRHFTRIITEDRIPVMQMGRKFFILASELNKWKVAHPERWKK